MLNYIWFGMIAASVICAAATGRLEALSTAIMNGAQQAVELLSLIHILRYIASRQICA